MFSSSSRVHSHTHTTQQFHAPLLRPGHKDDFAKIEPSDSFQIRAELFFEEKSWPSKTIWVVSREAIKAWRRSSVGNFFFSGGCLFQGFEGILEEFLDLQKSFRGFFFPGICWRGETGDFLLWVTFRKGLKSCICDFLLAFDSTLFTEMMSWLE